MNSSYYDISFFFIFLAFGFFIIHSIYKLKSNLILHKNLLKNKCPPCPSSKCPICPVCQPCPIISSTNLKDCPIMSPTNLNDCPKCPVCPPCQTFSKQNVIQNPTIYPPTEIPVLPPMYPPIYQNTHINDYQIVGYLHKVPSDKVDKKIDVHDPYKILPLYGKPYKGGFFLYYTTFISGDQKFKMFVTRTNSSFSRELNEGDEIKLKNPLNSVYRFQENNSSSYLYD